MPYKVIPAQRIARLQRVIGEKQRILQRLEQERAELENKHMLLSSTCEVLAILRQCRTSRATADTNAAANQHNSSLAEHEIQQIDLSQQLEWIYESLPHPDAQHLLHNLPEPVSRTSKSSAASSSDSTAAEPAAPDPYSTIAPANDPLQHLRGFLISKQQDTATSGPYTTFPLPSASVATLQQLQQFYCDCVIRLSAHVGFLESTADAAAANATATATLVKYHAQGLITLVTRYLRLVSDLVQHHREDLVGDLCLSNVVTGELGEQDLNSYLAALQQMDLSQQQHDDLLACSGFFERLLSAVVADRSRSHDDHHQKQQQQQQAQAQHQVLAANARGNSHGSNAGAAALDADAAAEMFMFQQAQQQRQQWQQVQEQQQRLQSLDVSIGKELTLVHAAMYVLWGRLTWLQAGKLMIACFPQPAVPVFFAAAMKQQLQQQQQRQHVRHSSGRKSK